GPRPAGRKQSEEQQQRTNPQGKKHDRHGSTSSRSHSFACVSSYDLSHGDPRAARSSRLKHNSPIQRRCVVSLATSESLTPPLNSTLFLSRRRKTRTVNTMRVTHSAGENL
ncbi:unnamed protein product, partial [Ectocarpus sp. 8 AP-2014]